MVNSLVQPGRSSATVVFAAAEFAEPEYEVLEIVTSKGFPPYEIVDGMPVGTGRVVAAKYGG